MSSAEGWTHLNNIIFERRQFKLRVRYLSHWDMIRSSNFWNHILQLPSVIIGSVAATAAFTTMEKENELVKLTVASLTALLAVLSALSQYFKFPEESEKHRDAALAYEALLHKIGAIRASDPSDQENFTDMILNIDNEYLKVKSVAPLLSEKLIQKHAAAESSIYSLHNENPHIEDIEAAIQESTSDQSEINAINSESRTRALEHQVEVIISQNKKLQSNNAIKVIIRNLISLLIRSSRIAISNWVSNLNRSAKINMFNIEQETLQFKLDIERASKHGVMRSLKTETDSEVISESQVDFLSAENSQLIFENKHLADRLKLIARSLPVDRATREFAWSSVAWANVPAIQKGKLLWKWRKVVSNTKLLKQFTKIILQRRMFSRWVKILGE